MSSPKRGALAVVLVVVTAGCTTAMPAWMPFTRSPEEAARGTAAVSGREGSPASGPNDRTGGPRAGQASDGEAVYQLGLLQADPTSSIRDYRAARATFTRLLIEFPRSRRTAEARAWQATLTDLLVREDEARRYAQRLQRLEEEQKRTRANYEWLKQTHLEPDRRR